MMKRVLSFLLCLIMVVSLAAPSVQANGSDNVYTTDNIMDNIVIENDVGVNIVVDEEADTSPQNGGLSNLANLVTEPTEPATAVIVEDCKCVDLASSVAHPGVCMVRAPYLKLCEKNADTLFAQWENYTADEKAFMLEHLKAKFSEKHEQLVNLLSVPTGSASETLTDGTTVSVAGIPENGSLTVAEATDEVQKIVDAYVAQKEDSASQLFSCDVSVQDIEGADWQPEDTVKMELELPGEKLHKNTQVYVVHVDDDGVATTIEAQVTEDGKIVFETPGFSAFFGFTVDFEYNGARFSLLGESGTKLSIIFEQLKIPHYVQDVVNVEFSDYSLISVTKQDTGDWFLTSLKSFQTNEVLTITMNNGQIFEIKVTDPTFTNIATIYEWGQYNNGQEFINQYYDLDGNGVVTWYLTGNGTPTSSSDGWSTNGYRVRVEGDDDRYNGNEVLHIDLQNSTYNKNTGKASTTELVLNLRQIQISDGASVVFRLGASFQGNETITIKATQDNPIFDIQDGCLFMRVSSPNTSVLPAGTDYSNYPIQANGTGIKMFLSGENLSTSAYAPLIYFHKGIDYNESQNLYIEDVTFQNANHRAILCETNHLYNLNLKRCKFESTVQEATYGGGGIYIGKESDSPSYNPGKQVADVGKFQLIDCEFNGVTAKGEAGAIVIHGRINTTFKLENCRFIDCQAKGGDGGAIKIDGGIECDIEITGESTAKSYFSKCTSSGYGGAIALMSNLSMASKTVKIEKTKFSGCTAIQNGGAIYHASAQTTGTFTVQNCEFTSCEADVFGGAISLIGRTTTVNITDNTFTSCIAGQLQEAYVQGDKEKGDNVDDKGNLLDENGQKIRLTDKKNNLAWNGTGGGGAICFSQFHDTINIKGTATKKQSFTNCLSLNNGGAISFEGSQCDVKTGVYFDYLLIDGCQARDSGTAIFLGTVQINEMEFANSLVQNCSYTTGRSNVLENSVYEDTDLDGKPFTDNTPFAKIAFRTQDAGGTFRTTGSTRARLSVVAVEFKNNKAHNNGAGIYWNANRLEVSNHETSHTPSWKSSLSIESCIFTDNNALRDGGGVYVEASLTLTGNCSFTGNIADRGGAIAQQVYTMKSRKIQQGEANQLILNAETVIDRNYARTHGGGISIVCNATESIDTTSSGAPLQYPITCQIQGAEIKNNCAAINGGGVYFYQMSYPEDYIEGVEQNTALDNKEVEAYIKSLVLDGSSIHGNYSGCGVEKLKTPGEANGAGSGGGVYLKAKKNTTLKILGCEIYSNSAHDGNGGGVYMTGLEGKCTIGLSELFKDTKGQWLKTVIGGAADKTNKAIRVSNDQNKGLGGGIAILDNARIEMQSGTVSYNEATTAGGGIAVHKQSSMWFTDGTVEYNKSINGGGISLNAAKAVNANSSKDEEKYGMFLDGGNVKNNKVIAPVAGNTVYGGGICISASSTMKISDGEICDNKAINKDETTHSSGQEGGGIAVCQGSELTIAGGKIHDNKAYRGGGIVVRGISSAIMNGEITVNGEDEVTSHDGSIYNNWASSYGGGIYVYKSDSATSYNSFTMNGGYIWHNECKHNKTTGSGGGSGGAVYLRENARFTLNGGRIEDNWAYNGGAICTTTSSVTTISGGVLKDNYSGRHGGAIYNDYGTVNVQNGVFTDNYAKVDGGAIFNYGKVTNPFTFSVTGGTFTGNIGKTGNGGALCSKGETAEAGCGSVYISNGTFIGNAGHFGGGMAAIQCSVQLEGGTFKQNVSNRGGGLYVEACPTATISNIIVQENKCKNDDRITSNTYQFGGGMTIISKGTVCDVTINTGDFSNNSAPKGGGIMLYNHSGDVAKPATLTINGGTINSNQALSGDGGGIHIDGGTYRSDKQQTKLTMNGGSINHNTASGNGGGVYVSNKGVALITTGTLNNQATHGEISQNTADNGGGVYVTTGANLSVVGGYITYNNASAPATATLSKTGFQMLSNLHGTGGGICVTTSTDANAKSTFTLSAPTGTNNMAIYGNQATFSADDVFSNGSNTQLTVPTVQGMNMEEYGFAPEGWFEDYNTNDSQYYLGINMKGATAGSHKAIRYRNAVGKQRLHIEPLYVLGKLNGQSVPAGKSYVNMPNAYVAMTLGLPAAVDDTIVIDYSGSVNVNLYDNDLFITQGEFAGNGSYLMEKLPTPDGTNVINKNYVYLSKGNLPVGSCFDEQHGEDRPLGAVSKGDGNPAGIITYSPKFSRPSTTARETWLSRTTADTFGYTVKHNGYWYYAKVTVVPATILYFEDNANYITYHTDSTIEQLATWKPVKADYDDIIDEDYHPDEIAGATDVYDVPSQDQDRPGYTGDPDVDQDNVYGNDTHYAWSYDFSNSSAHRVTVDRHDSVDKTGNNGKADGKCDTCGVNIAHDWKPLKLDENTTICAVCGKDHHCEWGTKGICKKGNCNNSKSHTCVDQKSFHGYCDICGKEMTHTRNARASFTFTGTGFDLFSLCSAKTGIVMVNVYKGTVTNFDKPPMDKDHYVTTYMVDTYYGYTEGDSTDNPSINLDSQAELYQVPVIKADLTKVMTVMDDPNTEANEAQYKNWGYGTYTVEVYVAPSFISSEHGYKGTDFYLDAVRIYNPAVYGGITESNKDIVDVYMADGEAWPCYVEVRNMLLEQGDLDWDHAAGDPAEGFVFIDGSQKGSLGTNDISTYRSFGPNNEVYLKQGQHIAFKLNLSNYGADVAGIQVGLKAIAAPMVTSSAPIEVTCSGMTKPLASVHLGTSEQYLDIGMKDANGNFLADGKVIVISNNNIRNIAITSIKITHNSEPDDYSRIKNVFESNMTTSWTAIEMLNAKQLADPVMTPKYPALSYNGMICYNVFFSAEELGTLTADDLGLAVFDSYDPEGTVETAKDVIMGATEIDGLYMVETNGVHAKYLSDTQYFRAFAKKADGSYVYSKMVSYSAVDYAKNVLAKSDDVKLKQLVVAMLNYGAEAQKFFDYKTDDLMNKVLTADDQALLAGFDASSLNSVGKVDPAKVGAFASTGGFASRYPAISFKGAFEINYFFTPANAVDGDMTLYLWNEDTYNSVTELTAENADKAVVMTLENGAYTGSSDEIFARRLDQTLYAAVVYESDGVTYCSGVLPYSIAAYCQKPPADVQALATAAAVYGCAAKQFFGE